MAFSQATPPFPTPPRANIGQELWTWLYNFVTSFNSIYGQSNATVVQLQATMNSLVTAVSTLADEVNTLQNNVAYPGYTLIKTLTASNSSSLTLSDTDTAGYHTLLLVVNNLVPSTSGNSYFGCKLTIGGTVRTTSMNLYESLVLNGVAYGQSYTSSPIVYFIGSQSTLNSSGALQSINGNFYITNMNQSAAITASGGGSFPAGSKLGTSTISTNAFSPVAVYTGLQIVLPDTMVSGTITVYGK
jgi:hypothetical protein